MKKFLIMLFITLIAVSPIMSQSQQIKLVDDTKYEVSKTYKVDARQFLEDGFNQAIKYIKANPKYLSQAKLRKASSWGFTIGSTHTWKASNLKTDDFYDVHATCKGVGENCYIFVEDASWGNKINQAVVDSIQKAFDHKTPADPNKGIYETVTEHFGDIPDVDGDSKVIILILDIKDSFNGSGSYVAGYFYGYNELPKSDYPNSNEAEIYYLDCNPSNLLTEQGRYDALNTTSHEFQHMVNFNYKPDRTTFLDEGCSLVSEVICGYPIYNQALFNAEPNQHLFEWREGDDVLIDYSRAAKYTTYMYEQFGTQYLRNLVSSNNNHTGAVSDALQKLEPKTNHRFSSTLENWHIANIANDFSIGDEFGYVTPNVGIMSSVVNTNSNVSDSDIEVERGGAYYLTFQQGSNLTIKFDNQENSELHFNVVKVGDNTTTIENLSAGTEYNFDDYGTTYHTLSFIVSNIDIYTTHNFSYTSTGYAADAVTLVYDLNPPTGVLSLTDGDTVAVVFDGVKNGRLDSIKVALRQAGSVYGGIYSQNLRGGTEDILGSMKSEPITVTSTIEERPVYDDITGYPDPWPNWVTVDLTSQNISTNGNFIAAFAVKGTYPENNRIMVTQQSLDNIHSYTYLQESSSGVPGWYYLTADGGTTAYAYLIRAYVSLVTDVEEEQLAGLPMEYRLEQNYPNPFNPTTKINYSIPESGFVTLKIYDVLGKEVSTLVNTEKSAGNYEVNFDASNLSTGIYIYTLKTNNFITSKKMMFVK